MTNGQTYVQTRVKLNAPAIVNLCKNTLFPAGNAKRKWEGKNVALNFVDSYSGDKTRDTKKIATTSILNTNTSHILLFDISSDFHVVFFVHPIIPKDSVVLYFSRTNYYFQGQFFEIPGTFQDKSRVIIMSIIYCSTKV